MQGQALFKNSTAIYIHRGRLNFTDPSPHRPSGTNATDYRQPSETLARPVGSRSETLFRPLAEPAADARDQCRDLGWRRPGAR